MKLTIDDIRKNDIVLINERPSKVLYIDSRDITYEPFEINKEWLELNGFLKKKKPDMSIFNKIYENAEYPYIQVTDYEDGEWNIHVDDDKFMTIGSMICHYAHEFQGFLRLCGYKQLANSFSV